MDLLELQNVSYQSENKYILKELSLKIKEGDYISIIGPSGTGLILAGVSPIMAIRYQLMVTFMMLSTTAIASFTACYLAYRTFFNQRKQII